jgi:hypothetical protein
MPGLLRGIARTAVVAGTATAVSNRVSRRQAGRWAAQDQGPVRQPTYADPAPEPARPAGDMDNKLAQLKDLAGLHASGVLSDAEFQAQKALILDG